MSPYLFNALVVEINLTPHLNTRALVHLALTKLDGPWKPSNTLGVAIIISAIDPAPCPNYTMVLVLIKLTPKLFY